MIVPGRRGTHRRRLAALLAAATVAVGVVAGTSPAAGSDGGAAETVSAPATWRVVTWNMWHGGSQVDRPMRKQLRHLERLAPDVVTFQESDSRAASGLARRLGWDVYEERGLAVVTPHKILAELGTVRLGGTVGLGARVARPDGGEAVVWTAHLGYTPYGPYDACFDGMSVDELMDREREARRPQQMTKVLAAMADDLAVADDVPVVLTGDLNTPSHLDWVPAAADLHCGYADVDWPATVLAEEAGFADSYRTAHPDPVAEPGNTWSPVYPRHGGATGRREPQDRIDVVMHVGDDLTVRGSRTYAPGDPEPYPHHRGNRWTSDHAAVVTTFEIGP